MNITLPSNCTTEASRMAWCRRALKKLGHCLTWMNRWEKEGISQIIYNKFPNKIKNRYEYKEKLTPAENSDFYRNLYTPIRNEIIDIYSIARKEADESEFWDIDFDRDFN